MFCEKRLVPQSNRKKSEMKKEAALFDTQPQSRKEKAITGIAVY